MPSDGTGPASSELRFRVDPHGYVQIQHGGRAGRRVALHRLAAYAWGIIDGLDDPREVDHVVPMPCYNAEENLEAVDERTHGRITRARHERRKRRVRALDHYAADGGGRDA